MVLFYLRRGRCLAAARSRSRSDNRTGLSFIALTPLRYLDDPFYPHTQLTDIGKIVEKNLLSSENISGVMIDRYVIMPDHIHAIIVLDPDKYVKCQDGSSRAPTPTNEMLPHIVSAFKRFCNKEIGNNIFQRGYIEHIIRDREDYETRAKYIYENPIRWYYDELYTEE